MPSEVITSRSSSNINNMKTYLIVFQINYQILAEFRYRVLLFEYKKWFLSFKKRIDIRRYST